MAVVVVEEEEKRIGGGGAWNSIDRLGDWKEAFPVAIANRGNNELPGVTSQESARCGPPPIACGGAVVVKQQRRW